MNSRKTSANEDKKVYHSILSTHHHCYDISSLAQPFTGTTAHQYEYDTFIGTTISNNILRINFPSLIFIWMRELHVWSRTTTILKFIQNHQNAKKEEVYGFGWACTELQ